MPMSLRPTTSKVREALFNILRDRINDASFLDLYAGTGAIGIEALKHGASEVIFIEASKICVRHIKQTLTKLGLSGGAKVIPKKVLRVLNGKELKDKNFDIIFLDPPYHTDEINAALTVIGRLHRLKPDGVVVAEHFVKKQLPHEIGSLQFIKNYRYGDTVLTLYKEFK